jgi:class 3 adenylate cyclase
MFCDVRTSISEGLTASELTTFINELMTSPSDIILRQRGTIDKFMGDAIMAFWNAPLDVSDHALRACRSAIEMAGIMAELNLGWQEKARAAAVHSLPSGSESASTPVNVAWGISAASSASTILRSVTRSMSRRGLKVTKLYGLRWPANSL